MSLTNTKVKDLSMKLAYLQWKPIHTVRKMTHQSSATYIHKITEFILDPVGDVGEGDLPLAQLGFSNQLQLGAVLEAIPAGWGQAGDRHTTVQLHTETGDYMEVFVRI